MAGGPGSRRRRSPGRLAAAPIELWFLVIALVWGVAQILLVPPFQVPDEGDHWFRAWALTDGQLTADREGMITLPGSFSRAATLYLGLVGGGAGAEPMPVSLDGMPGFTSYADLFNNPGTAQPIRIPSRVANYGPIGYLPQAAGIAVGRLAGVSPLDCFYLARLANLLTAIALVFAAIRLAPYGKEVFFLLALLPVTMYEAASVSCDAAAIAGAALFTALVLRAAAASVLRRRDAGLLVLASGVFLNVKPGYWALVLLALLIRPDAIGGARRKLLLFTACAVAAAAVFGVTYEATAVTARVGVAGGPPEQIAYLLGSPLRLLEVIGATLKTQWLVLLVESVGMLGWVAVFLPLPLYLLVLLVLPTTVFRGPSQPTPGLRERVALAAVGVAIFLTLSAELFVFLTPVGIGLVGYQGRYLVPVWLVLLLAVTGVRVTRADRGHGLVVVAAVLVAALDLATAVTTYSR